MYGLGGKGTPKRGEPVPCDYRARLLVPHLREVGHLRKQGFRGGWPYQVPSLDFKMRRASLRGATGASLAVRRLVLLNDCSWDPPSRAQIRMSVAPGPLPDVRQPLTV